MINRSVALEIMATFTWSWNSKIGLPLIFSSISDAYLREPCGRYFSISIRSSLIESINKTEGNFELEGSEIFLETRFEVTSILA